MNRVPSLRTLKDMPASHRHAILGAIGRDLRHQLEAIEDGIVFSVDGVPVAQYRRNVKRRLKKLYAVADHFGDFVGQGDEVAEREVRETLKDATRIAASVEVSHAGEFAFAAGYALGYMLGEDAIEIDEAALEYS